MNPFDLIKALLHASGAGGDRWIVSVDKVRKGPVTRTYTKMDAGGITLDFGYMDGDTEHKVWALVPLQTAGRPGGGDQIKFDGKDVEKDDLIASSRFVFPSGPILVVEFRFTDDSVNHVIRFDGRIVI